MILTSYFKHSSLFKTLAGFIFRGVLKAMSKYQYKSAELSIFDLQEEVQNYNAISKKLDAYLDISPIPPVQKMLEAILRTPKSFNEGERGFIKSCVLGFLYQRAFSEKQLNWMHNLYRRVPKTAINVSASENCLSNVLKLKVKLQSNP
jgi:hypothetical protein